ncbi:nucleoside 2-deoxyribosyltransferase domain-containing protein [Nannocystaceae bacterium ST9]
MKVVYAKQPFPESLHASIFLMGPTPRRETGGESWRPAMLAALERAGFDGVVFVPEDEHATWSHSYVEQITWEQEGLEMADRIVAWVPRELETMPAFTTNVEFGEFLRTGKLLYGRPSEAPKTRYLDERYAAVLGRPPLDSIEALAHEAVAQLGQGAAREGGECRVPLEIWRSPQFQSWYAALRQAGNRLDGARVLWRFLAGPKRDLFSFAVQVDVWVADEARHKRSEYVFARTDVSTIVAFARGARADGMLDEVVLVREFRATGNTRDGYVHELPGGSTFEPGQDPLAIAAQELEEETGLRIVAERFRSCGVRQVGATLSSHKSHVFAVELDPDEIAQARASAQARTRHGVGNSERTYVEVMTIAEMLSDERVDWTSVGAVLAALRR